MPQPNWLVLLARTSAQANCGAGCVFRSKIPSVRHATLGVQIYIPAHDLLAHTPLLPRYLRRSALRRDAPLLTDSTAGLDRYFLSAPLSTRFTHNWLSLLKYLSLGRSNPTEVTNDLINLPFLNNIKKIKIIVIAIYRWMAGLHGVT